MIKKIMSICTIMIWIACLFSIPSNKNLIYAKNEIQEETNFYKDMDKYLQTCVKNAHIPSMSITIVNKDDVLFSQNYGYCKSNDTPFFLGSVSKSFTAICVMQLVEQKKIDLNATLSTYLPNATDGTKILVRQLLNHTSGLGEYHTLKDYKIIYEQGIHHYANVNYSLLGEIIEKVSGLSYNNYITQNVFLPLQFTHTAASFQESQENGVIDGYINYWGIHVQKNHSYPSSKNSWISIPAGYISSSTNDLGKYLQMYLNGGNGLITKESMDTMFYKDTVYVDEDIPFWYGYGWATVKEPLSEPVLRHSGLVETGTSCVFILPKKEIGIAITSNVNDYFVTNNMMDSLGWGVVLKILGDTPNEISSNEYFFHHLFNDLIMLIVFITAILSICLLSKYRYKLKHHYRPLVALFPILINFIFAIFILLLVPVFFKTPLWVAKAFVPDVFIIVVISSILFLISGFIKTIILYQNKKEVLHH